MQNSDLSAILGETQNVRDASASIAYSTSYNMSPVFTDEMTTAGLVIVGHDSTKDGLKAWRTLLNLLFSSEEKPAEGNQATILEANGLRVDLPELVPTAAAEVSAPTAAIFTADMGLTNDPDNSPFNFCPSDE